MKTNRKIRLALIGTNGIPARYGGAETLFENLTRELNQKYDITVYCSKKQPKIKGNSLLNAKLKYWPLSANGWQSIPYDTISILHAANHSDVLYIFGFTAGYLIAIMRFFGFKKKVMFNHGGLNEWEREKISPANKWYSKWTRRILKDKVVHIVDNDIYVRSLKETFGIDSAKVIRYGGDNAFKVNKNSDLLAKYPYLNDDYYVSVSRAQIDNNLHIVLDAFSQMPNKKLVLVSNWNISQYGINLKDRYKNCPNIVLQDGVYDKIELNAIRSNARAYIHSHSRCGTPPSLCEAMYLGLPIISFDVEVNHETTQEHALFFKTPNELKDIITSFSDDSLNEYAKLSYDVAKNNYTWQRIGQQYCDIINQ